MKRFKSYLREHFLLEYKEWHGYIKDNGDTILSKIGHTEEYAKLSSEPGHGSIQHKTNYIKRSLGISDMSQEHGRWVLGQIQKDSIPHHEDITTSIATNLRKFDQLKSEGKIKTTIKGNIHLGHHHHDADTAKKIESRRNVNKAAHKYFLTNYNFE